MNIRSARVEVADGEVKLWVAFSDGRAIHVPVSAQVAIVLNAGGWMMREHLAKVFEEDLNGVNLVSRRIRAIQVEPQRPSEKTPAPRPASAFQKA